MRKTALKKKYPNRHEIIKTLKSKNWLETFIMPDGHEVILNIMKRTLYNKPYKNQEHQMEVFRKMNEYYKRKEMKNENV